MKLSDMKFPTNKEIKRKNLLKRMRELKLDYIDIARIARIVTGIQITRRDVASVMRGSMKSLPNIIIICHVLYHEQIPEGYKEFKGFA